MADNTLMRGSTILLLTACCFLSACDSKVQMQTSPSGKSESADPRAGAAVGLAQRKPADKPEKIISVSIKPARPQKGEELVAKAETDTGDSVAFDYAWSINDNEVSGATGPSLKAAFSKGDTIMVRVTPVWAGVPGYPVSRVVTIANSPPVVKSDVADMQMKGTHYTFRIQAEDPDGDALTYALLSAPAGMTIDSRTGVISGEYNDSMVGEQKVQVSVKDGDDGEARVEIPVNIDMNAPPATAAR